MSTKAKIAINHNTKFNDIIILLTDEIANTNYIPKEFTFKVADKQEILNTTVYDVTVALEHRPTFSIDDIPF